MARLNPEERNKGYQQVACSSATLVKLYTLLRLVIHLPPSINIEDMDFLRKAKELTDTAQTLADEAKAKAAELTTSASTALNQSADEAKTVASAIVSSSTAEAERLITESTQFANQSLESVGKAVDSIKEAATGFAASGLVIADALKSLPQTAEELAREMPKIARRLEYGAGLRVGDMPRSDADIMQLFNKIPGTSKLDASELKIRQFLADKHGSHIVSRRQAGSNSANNIVWEVGSANIQRGSRVMTSGEQVYIRFYNAVDSILQNSATVAKLGITATGTAILTQALVTAAAYTLDLYRGDITMEEFRDRILEAAIAAGITAPIFFLLLIAVIALFPELAIILSAPAVVAGFNVLFGVGIAVPIIQSMIRHLQAGGFGDDVAHEYESLLNQLEGVIQSSAQQVLEVSEKVTTNLKKELQGFLPTADTP